MIRIRLFVFLIFVIPGQVRAADPVSGGIPFPHLALYGGTRSDGRPFVDITQPGYPLVDSVVEAYAKRQLVILNVDPLANSRKDIAVALRARNPDIKIFGYTLGSLIWCTPVYGPTVFYRRYWETVEAYDGDSEPFENCDGSGNGFLWKSDGQRAETTTLQNVNLAHRDGSGRYDLAEDMATLFYNDIYLPTAPDGTKIFDGIFLDAFSSQPDYGYDPNYYDYTRAGYPDNASFLQGWKEGFLALTTRLRSLINDPNYPIVANAGSQPTWTYSILNGQMIENYPYQPGSGGWNNAMYSYPGGYFFNDKNFRSPQYNFIFTAANVITPYSPSDRRKMRFGLGSATLGNGFAAFEDGGIQADLYDYYNWWYDEYAVDLSTGQASTSFGDAGWLGLPTGDAYQMIWTNSNPELVPANGFEMDFEGLTLLASDGAVAVNSRDSATAAQGTYSLHIQINQLGTGDSSVRLNAPGFPTTSGGLYSVTFWAKASQPRIKLVMGGATGGLTFPITTSWKRYQFVFRATSSSAFYQFQLGQAIGDVWLDDIHVQQGITDVYRRDFDNGIVLVNPYDIPLTVPLERSYQKINGTVSPEINDGSIVFSVTLTPSPPIGDAIFLLNGPDTTPPGKPKNLMLKKIKTVVIKTFNIIPIVDVIANFLVS
ncbi:MAG: hypothetical protein HY399_07930 [Elusimicrobia bacterium]|nr:hypothetical protein [Elusimicrobiota bacterium]